MKKYLLAISFILVSFVGLRWYYSAHFYLIGFQPVLQLNISYCPIDILSDEHGASIAQCINMCIEQKKSTRDSIAFLKKQFPIIKKVVIAFNPLETLIRITPHEPICCLNDNYALASNNQLFSKEVFSSAACDMVPAVSIAAQCVSNAAELIPTLFSLLPSDFSDFYNLSVVSDHSIRLADKNDSQFTIVLAIEQKNYSTLLSKCESIKKIFSARGAFDRGMEWIADARFAHYIVAYKT